MADDEIELLFNVVNFNFVHDENNINIFLGEFHDNGINLSSTRRMS